MLPTVKEERATDSSTSISIAARVPYNSFRHRVHQVSIDGDDLCVSETTDPLSTRSAWPRTPIM